MKKNEKKLVKFDIGKVGMIKLSKMINEGSEFSKKYLQNPLEFCENNNYSIYNGYGINEAMGKTYVLVHEINVNSFAVIWIYPDGNLPTVVVEKDILNNFKKGYEFFQIDKEVFLIWLRENIKTIINGIKIWKDKENKFMQKSGT